LGVDSVYYWRYRAFENGLWSDFSHTFAAYLVPYVCGNVDGLEGPSGPVDIADLTYLVSYLFSGGPAPPAMEAANVDGITGPAGPVDIADVTYLVAYLFLQGPAPDCE